MRYMSLTLSVALMVMLLTLAGLAGAPAIVIPAAQAQYADNGQYGTGQYAPSNSGQSVTPTSCQQEALNALNVPSLRSSSAASNLGLLEQYIKCGGTIASLPQNIFNTLMSQGVITISVVDNSTNACPKGDPTNCSSVNLGWTH